MSDDAVSRTPHCSALLRQACAAAVALAIGALPAQDKPTILRKPRPSVSTELHEAWLKEVLDLDQQAATQAYDRIRMKAPRAQPERWLAITRMLELARIGVIAPEPGTMPRNAPQPVLEAMQAIEMEVPFEKLLSDPRAEIELPPLRQATRRVQDWARNQIGPTVEERVRMRVRVQPSSSTPDPEQQARWRLYFARQVLRVELEGRESQAEAMRWLDFPDWEAPPIVGEPREALDLALRRLDDWILEADSWMRSSLRNLKKHLSEADEDPQQSLAFLQELPIIADRLLAPPDAGEGQNAGEGRNADQGQGTGGQDRGR